MTQVDLETLVTTAAEGGNDRKIACQTLADRSADDDPHNNGVIPDEDEAANVLPDYPPESFWLSKDAEYDWFDRNVFYPRKESTKGNSNSHNLNPHINPSSNSSSQRFAANLKSMASIFGLPKTQKTAFVDTKRRICKPAIIRLFPKRSESVGKSTVPVSEPGSPKVSCIGRVRSKRGRRRSNSSYKRRENLGEKAKIGGEKRKTGCYSRFISMFHYKKGRRKPEHSDGMKVMEVLEEEPAVVVEQKRKSVSMKVLDIRVSIETVAEPPGLGGMKRFSSGRRSGSWTAEDFNQAVSVTLESERCVDPMSRS